MNTLNIEDLIQEKLDLQARMEELDTEREELLEKLALASNETERESLDLSIQENEQSTNELIDKLGEFKDLEKSLGMSLAKSYKNNLQLIDEEDFTEYVEDTSCESGHTSNIPYYILCHIDWDGVADDMRGDYEEVDFRGSTYLWRE